MAGAGSLRVDLWACARWDSESTKSGVVGEAAWVSWESGALASGGVESGSAWAGQNCRAGAQAVVSVVDLWGCARWDNEGASGGVVNQVAFVSWKG